MPGQSEDHKKVNELMQAIGSSKGYDPCPPGQHHWHRDEQNGPLQRMWSEIFRGTMGWGHRTPYYTIDSSGTEGHVEHLAKKLGIDIANAYRTCRQGVARGLWRYGTKDEGDRRIYLCGDVPRGKHEKPDPPEEKDWPPHIWKHIKDWPAERIAKLKRDRVYIEELVDLAIADHTAACRSIGNDLWDARLGEEGIAPARQTHRKKAETEEEDAARRTRVASLIPSVQKSVQSLREIVQSRLEDTVQSPATLLPSQSKSQSSRSRSVRQSAANGHSENHTRNGERPPIQLPALPHPAALSDPEKQAMQTVYAEVGRLQNKYRHMMLALEPISAHRPSDQRFAYAVLAAVGTEYVGQCMLYCEQRLEKWNRNALGKSSRELPRGLGAVYAMALEYAESIDESAKIEKSERDRWLARGVCICKEVLESGAETVDAKKAAADWLNSPQLQETHWQQYRKLAEAIRR